MLFIAITRVGLDFEVFGRNRNFGLIFIIRMGEEKPILCLFDFYRPKKSF